MPNHLLILMSNPAPGREAEYNAWYDEHLVDTVRNHPGIVAGRRLVQADLEGRPVHPYKYVAVYEVAEDALDEAYEYFIGRRRDRARAAVEGREAAAPVPDFMDLENATVAFFMQVGPEARRMP